MMKFKNLIPHSFQSVGQQMGLAVQVVDGKLQIRSLRPRPVDHRPLWAQRLSSKSSFCRAVVQSGLLSRRQMVHAALRYRLGRSKDDAVIYWQIDELNQLHDGKLMWYGADCHRQKNRNASWVMHLLKKHYGVPQDTFQPQHCFFGQHLLATASVSSVVCVVEAEKTAVILSELYPQYIWLAAGGLGELQVNKFFPLRHYKVILFPDTDPDCIAYTRWYNAAQQVVSSFSWPKNNPIHVSDYLELYATEEQKARKIDLVDFLILNA